MSNTERKRVLNYRNDNGSAPNPDNIDYGEIAIGYKKDNEAIYIKNSTDEIVDFTPTSIVNITYNELKELRDNSKLKPSQYYRITDFVTTVANDEEARSAGHPFDIIVCASDKNKLQEECYAIQHEGDEYFANCNLAAWKIWYCLDNDNTKYAWANTVNGKGVIYRMIDEFYNDCPYDFKNIQFKRYAVKDASSNGELSDLNGKYIGYNSDMTGLTIPVQSDFIWMYTFSLYKENNELVDYSSNCLHGPFTDDISYANCIKKGQCAYNTLSNTYGSVNIDGQFYVSLTLNNIVLISEMGYEVENTTLPGEMVRNTFGSANFNVTLKNNPENNKFGTKCYNNIADGFANTFGSACSYNTFGSACSYNTFGNYVRWNTFGNNCEANSFGNSCYDNQFGNNCWNNSFGNGCDNNQFGNNCWNNSFGNDCDSNSFGNSCYENTFGNGCDNNQFGNYVRWNTFGNGCDNNQFGNYCWYNQFGNYVRWNTFGNNFQYNSFGNNCWNNSFGNNFQYNALGNDVQYVEITTEKIYHTQILNGTKGTSSEKLTIGFTPETVYSQFAGLTSNNKLKTWVEADVPTDVVDGGTY